MSSYLMNTTNDIYKMQQQHDAEQNEYRRRKEIEHELERREAAEAVRSLDSRDNTPSKQYESSREELLKRFLTWTDCEQVDLVQTLLVNMHREQHGEVNNFLKPMLKRDFISQLAKRNMDRVAEMILSYLDPRSLCAAEQVNKEWHCVVGSCVLWRKLIERRVSHDSLWRGLCERKDLMKELFRPTQKPDSYYKSLYSRILQTISKVDDNWRHGKHSLKKIQCQSESSKGVYCLQYDDDKIVSGLRDNTIKIWDRTSLKCLKTLTGHNGSVLCLQYDDNIIISGSSDSTVRVWNIKTGEQLNALIHHCEAVLHLRFCDGVMVTCSKDRSIAVWDMTSPSDIVLRRVLVGHRAAVNVVDFDHKYIVSASGDRTIKVWSTNTCEFVRTLAGHRRGIACLQYRDRLVVSGSSDNTIRLWDIEIGNCLRVLEGHEELVRCIRFDGKRIVSGAYDGKIKVWDLNAALNPASPSSQLCVRTLIEHTGRVFRLQFDEFQIVSSSHDDTILVWDFLEDDTVDNGDVNFEPSRCSTPLLHGFNMEPMPPAAAGLVPTASTAAAAPTNSNNNNSVQHNRRSPSPDEMNDEMNADSAAAAIAGRPASSNGSQQGDTDDGPKSDGEILAEEPMSP